jgi:hypothetical protein
MPLQGYKPLQIKSKHSFSCICSKEKEKKKEKKKSRQFSPAAAAPLKNGSYPQIWVDIELRKPNPKLRTPNTKPKLDTMNDKNIVYKKNKKNYLSLYFIILIPALLKHIPSSATVGR